MNEVLTRWNGLSSKEAAEEILPCCGSRSWAKRMAFRRPILGEAALLGASDEVWNGLLESDWHEAFRSHSRIGEPPTHAPSATRSADWAREEQQKVGGACDEIKMALAEGNREYEKRFHRIFIVCASGKSAPDILEILRRRLRNEESTELLEAAEEQRKIAQLRLRKWLVI
jgi:2-oxo-4-hydroxy-4-carboxy-5-ureidoimidazoline decarboxylase